MAKLPLIAILRGIKPNQASAIGHALFDAGFRMIEVPLNSPNAFESIEILAREFNDQVLLGAGTVLEAEQVQQTLDAGGKLIIAPNLSDEVSTAVFSHECIYCPGVSTPTEAFQAIALGADALKLFPAEVITPTALKAWHAVLPENTPTFPVGGITPENMSGYLAAGAAGFGVGSALYSAGKSAIDVKRAATEFAVAYGAT